MVENRPSAGQEFVGRRHEIAELGVRLAAARDGSGGIVLLSGDAGIGKTRLAVELAAIAGLAGLRALWGRCYDDKGTPAYWPWIQVLRALATNVPARELDAVLGADGPVLASLLPDLASGLAGPPVLAPLEPDAARFRLFEAIAATLGRAAAATPLLVVIDDLQWSDAASLAVLRFLAPGLAQSSILLLAIHREHETRDGESFGRAIGDLAHAANASRTHLTGLDRGEAAALVELVAGFAPAPEIAAGIYAETEGNPFFIAELVRLLGSEGRLSGAAAGIGHGVPPTVLEVIERRLQRLSPACRETLTVAAVAGREFALGALQQSMGGDAQSLAPVESLLDALDEARAEQLIHELPGAPGRYRFAHSLIHRALYKRLSTRERVQLHRRVGEALERATAADPGPRLTELAHHFLQAALGGDAERAVDYSRRAAEQALAQLAFEPAAALYQQALQALDLQPAPDEVVRCELLLALGGALNAVNDRPAAKATAQRAAAVARSLRRAECLARAAMEYSTVFASPNVSDPIGIALLEEAHALFGGQDSVAHAMVLERLSRELLFSPLWERAEATNLEGLAMARRLGDPMTLGYCLTGRYLATSVQPEDAEESVAVAAESLRLGERSRDTYLTLQGHFNCAMAYLRLGEGSATAAHVRGFAQATANRPEPVWKWMAQSMTAMLDLMEGRLVDAEAAVDAAQAGGEVGEAPSFPAQLFLLRRERGRGDELIDAVLAISARYPSVLAWRGALALLYADSGRGVEARRELEQAATAIPELRRDMNWLPALVLFAELTAGPDDTAQAAELYRVLQPSSRLAAHISGWDTACLGPVAYYLGLLATTRRRWDAATEHFDEALRISEKLRSPLWRARGQHGYAAMLAARGEPGDRERAASLLAGALATARELGMTRLAGRGEALLQHLDLAWQQEHGAATAATTLPEKVYPDGVTPREAEVLRLIAAGQSNKEIAAALALSVPTVERHVVNLYRKISARGRADATAYAFQRGLAGPLPQPPGTASAPDRQPTQFPAPRLHGSKDAARDTSR